MEAKDVETMVEKMWSSKTGRRNLAFSVFAVFVVCTIVYHMVVQH